MTQRLPIGLFAFVLAYGCAHEHGKTDVAPASAQLTKALIAPAPLDMRAQRNGRAFPPGVFALTWDDGPDLRTLALAEYLHREHVSATFFVVNEWVDGVSSDPGFGPHVYETGHAKLPLLGDLVALGHRVANHTAHHTLLGKLPEARVDMELGDAQRSLDPLLRDELRLFRVPGGDWTPSASQAVDADPYLAQLVGPIRWDIDAKDWEGSVWCESSKPSHECEHQNGRWRVRADVMAKRYEAAIESAGRGIVLLHDRLGDVGSDYAYELAQKLVPRLAARGYVFAAPVLEFGAPRTRWNVAQCGGVRLGDIDGDGRADACVRDSSSRVTCATSSWRHDHGLERVAFDETQAASVVLPARARSYELADVNGDGHADVCVRAEAGIECALAHASGGFGAFAVWSASHEAAGEQVNDFSDVEGWGSDGGYEGTIRFADIDGDGKADVCGRSPQGAWCARSTGAGFERARLWLNALSDRSPWVSATLATTVTLGDVNGDGRADLCVRGKDGIDCAVSTGAVFSHFTRWSSETPEGALVLSDLNGDGRADLCASTNDGIACAFSNGRTFTKSTTWLAGRAGAEWGRIGDVNGDGRGDFCDCDSSGVRCGLAP